MTKILLLEDDLKMASEIKIFLKNQGYTVDVVYEGLAIHHQEKPELYDLYILDINVPNFNGIEVCKMVRADHPLARILMLTAYSDVEQKVKAFNSGADDYLVKPFHFDELDARIKALLRRNQQSHDDKDTIINIADLEINTTELKVIRSGKELSLTPKEYKLLELLAQAKGRVVSKQTIAEKVWDLNFETGTNTIEVYINFIRNKIDKGHDQKLIHTRPGFGYYLKEE